LVISKGPVGPFGNRSKGPVGPFGDVVLVISKGPVGPFEMGRAAHLEGVKRGRQKGRSAHLKWAGLPIWKA
jgi:hypothetical protein